MKTDIETRGRPRNDDFVDFCDLLEADFPEKEMAIALPGEHFLVYGILQNGKKKEYKNFRNSVALAELKKKLSVQGFKVSVYFEDGLVYIKARKV